MKNGRAAHHLETWRKTSNHRCAESCTDGILAAAFTSVAGSSQWISTSFVTYATTKPRRPLGRVARNPARTRRGQPPNRLWDGARRKKAVQADPPSIISGVADRTAAAANPSAQFGSGCLSGGSCEKQCAVLTATANPVQRRRSHFALERLAGLIENGGDANLNKISVWTESPPGIKIPSWNVAGFRRILIGLGGGAACSATLQRAVACRVICSSRMNFKLAVDRQCAIAFVSGPSGRRVPNANRGGVAARWCGMFVAEIIVFGNSFASIRAREARPAAARIMLSAGYEQRFAADNIINAGVWTNGRIRWLKAYSGALFWSNGTLRSGCVWVRRLGFYTLPRQKPLPCGAVLVLPAAVRRLCGYRCSGSRWGFQCEILIIVLRSIEEVSQRLVNNNEGQWIFCCYAAFEGERRWQLRQARS